MARLGPEELLKRLDRALETGGRAFTPRDVAAFVEEGKFQCWQRNETCVLTEIQQYPRYRVLNVFAIIGELNDAMDQLPEVIAFARKHDCKKIMAAGRPGWKKIVPKYGFKVNPRIIFEMDIAA